MNVRRVLTFRGIHLTADGDYVDRAVTGYSRGEGKKPCIMKEVIYGHYRLIEKMSPEDIDDGLRPPKHDRVFTDPSDFTYHYLRRSRRPTTATST